MKRLRPVPLSLLLLLIGSQVALGAISVSRAELSGGNLRVEGSGAVANSTVTVDGGAASARAGSSGGYRIERSGFLSPSCNITVSDGSTSTGARLTGCTPSAPPPTTLGPPTPTGPANGSSALQPLPLSWTAVTGTTTDPVVGYSWQVATSATFGSVVAWGSVSVAQGQIPPTSAALSGLANGTYFWRVNAIQTHPTPTPATTTAWSTVWSVTILGPGIAPAAPTITAPADALQFHPYEPFTVDWTPVSTATRYLVEVSNRSDFTQAATFIDNGEVTGTSRFFNYGFEAGTLFYRVRGIAADGTRGLPSAPRSFRITYAAPVPAPPVLAAPADGQQITLPVTFDWADVPNSEVYELQIDDTPAFTGDCGSIDLCVRGIDPSTYTVATSLGPGTKYWRVRSYHGASSPSTAAVTAWSATRSVVVPGAATALVSLSFYLHGSGTTPVSTVYSGVSGSNLVRGLLQLNGPAPTGGLTVGLASSDPAALGVPASATVPAGESAVVFDVDPKQVVSPTPVTVNATFGGTTLTTSLTVLPPGLRQLDIGSGIGQQDLSSGTSIVATVILNGRAPATGAEISLTSNSTAAALPATLVVAPDGVAGSFVVQTSAVTTPTPVTLTATWNGGQVSAAMTLHPATALLLPGAGASFASGAPITFRWAALNGFFSYTIQIDDSATFTLPLLYESDRSTTTDDTVATLPGGTLYWRIQARDQYGRPGPWSEVRSFQVAAPTGPPAAPTLMFPANNSRVTRGATVAFMWSVVTGASSYELQVDNSSTFGAPFTLNPTVVGINQYQTTALPIGRFWWRVRAIGSSGTPGSWSTVRQLEVR